MPSLSMPDEADDEPRHAIDALARHGAIALFVERARAVDPTRGRACSTPGRWSPSAIALFDLTLLRVGQGRHLDAGSPCEEAIPLFHELGDRWGIALCLGILAGAEAAAGRARRAATLAGAMQGLLASVIAPAQASFERWIGASHLTHAERELGAEAWRDGLAEGRAMTPPGPSPTRSGRAHRPLTPGRWSRTAWMVNGKW